MASSSSSPSSSPLAKVGNMVAVSNPNSSPNEKVVRALEALTRPHDLDSIVSELSLSRLRGLYSIPEEFVLLVPEPGQRAYDPIPGGFALTIDAFEAGLRLSRTPS
ncbi:hypothetical protein C4D60_Mb08t02350 [Musa balbisiana]|uniref:Uncharacterized protein n=1 Tax=Musa balbisiana TaxID=52838 RepID=A0A4S8K0R7_MUSBA|nr:hypothetical protein C4D60_Mb08t02350 [Musa balbisiana]